jgi:geranylgeranyl pyrophosphate synthase
MLSPSNILKASKVFYPKGIVTKHFNTKIAEIGLYKKYKAIFEEKHVIEKFYPSKLNDTQHVKDYLEITDTSDIKMSNQAALKAVNAGSFEPCWPFIGMGGKRWRPIYGQIIGKLLGVKVGETDAEKEKLLLEILSCLEVIHTSAVVLDDLADGSDMRRGIPCLHVKHGYGVGINAGIELTYHPFRQLIRMRPTEAIKYFRDYMEEVSWLYTGQSLDTYYRLDKIIPEEVNYFDIAMCKTALMPRLLVKMIFSTFSKNTKLRDEMIAINNKMFTIHQMKDDLANIHDSGLSRMKGLIGEDLTEGKLTLMALKTLEFADEKFKQRYKEIMLMGTKDQQILNEGIKIMKDCGAIAYNENKMKELYEECKERILNLEYLLDETNDATAIPEILEFLEILMIFDK